MGSQVVIKLVGTREQTIAAVSIFALKHAEMLVPLFVFYKLIDHIFSARWHLVFVFDLVLVELISWYYRYFPVPLNDLMCINHGIAEVC